MLQLTNRVLYRIGYRIQKVEEKPSFDMEDDFITIYEKCKNYTVTSIERMYSLYKSVEYIVQNKIPGDLAECGVWRGGSCMLIAYTLQKLSDSSRKIYLYDTFSGMSDPTSEDRIAETGELAQEKLQQQSKDQNSFTFAAYYPLEGVKENLQKTKYPMENIIFVQGKVENTIPETIPSQLCLLRLDTDWYESTAHELKHLYPRLVKNGVLIIDDYGHFTGARKATDEFISRLDPKPLLQRIDYTGRLLVKT